MLQMVLFASLSGADGASRWHCASKRTWTSVGTGCGSPGPLYKRSPQTPKTEQSVRDIVMSPVVRRVLRAVPWQEGYVFSPDGGETAIGDGSWLKRQWRKAQVRAGIRRPIRWHDLRHQFVSLLIAAAKDVKYIAQQAGHASAGFTLDRYGHLFETIAPTHMEWPEDLLWVPGEDPMCTICAQKEQDAGGNPRPD